VSLRLKHDYHNIISSAAATAAASPGDNIVWLEHLIHIDLSQPQSAWDWDIFAVLQWSTTPDPQTTENGHTRPQIIVGIVSPLSSDHKCFSYSATEDRDP